MIIPSHLYANHSLRRAGQILANGKKAQHTTFVAYPNLIIALEKVFQDEERRARLEAAAEYRQEPLLPADTNQLVQQAYLKALSDYFEAAIGHVAQAATREEIASLLDEIKMLINVHGLIPVGTLLRRMAAAPVDVF